MIQGHKQRCDHCHGNHPDNSYEVGDLVCWYPPTRYHRFNHRVVPLDCQECKRQGRDQKSYHGDIVGVYELTEEAAEGTGWKRVLDRDEEVDSCEEQGGYVCNRHVEKKVVGGCPHALKHFDHSNDKQVTDESYYYNEPQEHHSDLELNLVLPVCSPGCCSAVKGS